MGFNSGFKGLKTLWCKRILYGMSNTGVYSATPWQELKFDKSVVSIYGRSLHHPLSSLHCFTILMNSKQAYAVLWCWFCHPLHTKGCLFIAQSCPVPEAVKSVQIGTHPRSHKVVPIYNFTCHICASFINSFHCHVQNAAVRCYFQELLPFLSVIYPFLPPFSTS